MKFTKYLTLVIAVAVAAFSLSACSGGSTATGLGLSVGGNWKGQLFVGSKKFASFNMSLQQTAADEEDPFSASELIGTFNSDNECTGGGEITGTISGDSITLSVNDISMTGKTSNNSMSGSWFVSAAASATVSTEATTEATTTGCSTGGSWNASR